MKIILCAFYNLQVQTLNGTPLQKSSRFRQIIKYFAIWFWKNLEKTKRRRRSCKEQNRRSSKSPYTSLFINGAISQRFLIVIGVTKKATPLRAFWVLICHKLQPYRLSNLSFFLLQVNTSAIYAIPDSSFVSRSIIENVP